MIAFATRPSSGNAATPARFRLDSPARRSEVYPESVYLRHWAARQAARYQDLLGTIAAAPRPVRQD